MPRRPRITLPSIPLHVIQRGNNRQACFFADADYRRYLDWLEQSASENDCLVHAFVLMTNHVHLLITPATARAAGAMMKQLGQRYVQYINRTYGRSGTLWEGRFRSCLTQQDEYVLACYRYIELNPVRAGIVAHPAEYPWSSYRSNAQQCEYGTLLTPHSVYMDLGDMVDARWLAYRELFGNRLDPGMVDDIRDATNGNLALGSKRFKEQIAIMLGRRVEKGRPGRPPRKSPIG